MWAIEPRRARWMEAAMAQPMAPWLKIASPMNFAALFSDEKLKTQLSFRRSFDLAASSSCPNLSNFSASMILRTFGNIFFSSSSTA